MATCCACVRWHLFAVMLIFRSYTIVSNRNATTYTRRPCPKTLHLFAHSGQLDSTLDSMFVCRTCTARVGELMLKCSKKQEWYLCRILELTQVQFHSIRTFVCQLVYCGTIRFKWDEKTWNSNSWYNDEIHVNLSSEYDKCPRSLCTGILFRISSVPPLKPLYLDVADSARNARI